MHIVINENVFLINECIVLLFCSDKVVSFVPTTKKQLRQLRDLEDNGVGFQSLCNT